MNGLAFLAKALRLQRTWMWGLCVRVRVFVLSECGGNQNSSKPVLYYSSDVSLPLSPTLSMGNPTLFDLSLSCHHSLRLCLARNHGCLTESPSLCGDERAASPKKRVDFKRKKEGGGGRKTQDERQGQSFTPDGKTEKGQLTPNALLDVTVVVCECFCPCFYLMSACP